MLRVRHMPGRTSVRTVEQNSPSGVFVQAGSSVRTTAGSLKREASACMSLRCRSFVPPASHAARTHAVVEAYGLLWVQLQPEAGVPLPAFAAEADTQLRKVLCGPYDVATSAPRIVESFLDMAHFGFVHEGWLGMREATAIDDYRVEPTPTGLLATQCRAWQPQSNVHSTAPCAGGIHLRSASPRIPPC